MRLLISLILVLCTFISFSQNVKDLNGLKQGVWEVRYDNGSIRYEGVFKDDIEQGIFRFYYMSGQLQATKEFS